MAVTSSSLDSSPSSSAFSCGFSFATAFRLARRELRGGFAGFRIFLACLTLGVAAIAAVGSVSSALVEGLAAEGQSILGGDVDIRLIHRAGAPEELVYIEQDTTVSRSIEMRAMAVAPRVDERTLIELKAVDGVYPLYGAVTLDPAQPLDEALARREGRWGGVVEELLLDRLGIEVGDVLLIGDLEIEVRGVIAHEPDRVAGGFALGPRVMLAEAAMPETGLIRLGSLVSYHYRVQLPEAARAQDDVAAWVEGLNVAFPQAGWRVQDRSNSAPGMRRFIERVALFLSLVGLTALVVGGVGVGNAVKTYLDGKRDTIATLKCLGAPGALIFTLYLMQVLALAFVGIVIGLALGAVTPFVVEQVLGDALPVPTRFALYPGPLVLAAAYGVLTALAFAIWPLARARDVPASSLFRDLIVPVRRLPGPLAIGATALALAVLAGLAIGLSDEKLFASWFVAGAAASFVVLRGVAAGLAFLAKRAGRPRHAPLRLALANLYRPGAPTASVVLSVGLGLTLLVTISLIDGNIAAQIRNELPDQAPSFFFVDIQPDQVEGFEEIVADADVRALARFPMLRGRIVKVGGIASEDLQVAPNVAWALRGDRGITYADDLPAGSTLVSGSWWAADYVGPPLVSLSHELAEGFGVGVGDALTVNILGREMTAEIASTREIDWTTLGINFVLVFSPAAVQSAPHTHLATVTMAEEGERALQRAVSVAFPNVSSVRVKEALGAVNDLLTDLAVAMRAMSLVALAAGILVLVGAMAAGYRARVYDAVVLKVLGASRARVLSVYLMEYGVLGVATAIVAVLIGTVAAWLVITQVMDAPWVFLPGTVLATIAGATIATVVLGLAGTYRALGVKAAPILRSH